MKIPLRIPVVFARDAAFWAHEYKPSIQRANTSAVMDNLPDGTIVTAGTIDHKMLVDSLRGFTGKQADDLQAALGLLAGEEFMEVRPSGLMLDLGFAGLILGGVLVLKTYGKGKR